MMHLSLLNYTSDNKSNTFYTNFTGSCKANTVSLRRLIERLRDTSKSADFQISGVSLERLIKNVSSETSLRSLRFSQRRL